MLVTSAAIKEGHYDRALAAHAELYYSADEDVVLSDIVTAVHEAYRKTIDSFGNPLGTEDEQLPTLDQMRKVAETTGSIEGRDNSIRKITETAVLLGKYNVAIDVATSSYYSEAASGTLRYVSLCAAEEYLFVQALDAAAEIPITRVQDKVTEQVLRAMAVAETMSFSGILDPPFYRCRT